MVRSDFKNALAIALSTAAGRPVLDDPPDGPDEADGAGEPIGH